MLKQMQWLKELLDKKPREYAEFFYSDIQHYFGIDFEDENKDVLILFNLCGDYIKEFIVCKNKKEVKKWLDPIAFYIIYNVEVDYLIENFINRKKVVEEDTSSLNNGEAN